MPSMSGILITHRRTISTSNAMIAEQIMASSARHYRLRNTH
jgi:hypothetical protein